LSRIHSQPCSEDLKLLAREVNVHLRRDRERARRLTLVERRDLYAAVLDVEDLLAVGRELRVRLEALRRSELTRDGRLARKLVEREEVYVRLVDCARNHQDVLTVGADGLIEHVHADGEQAQPTPYSVEDDLDGLLLLIARAGLFLFAS
jgi:hypothetical protein